MTQVFEAFKTSRALLIGDTAMSRWHPLHGVDDQMVRILEDLFLLDITEDYPALTLPDLQKYTCVINYIDAWANRGTAAFAGALAAYVALGGSLLILHNGIICREHPELEQLAGASFKGHPERELLRYECVEQHPANAGIEPFEISEEPYQFTMDPLLKPTILLEYTYQGEKYPAAWLRPFGNGQVVYISIGHDSQSFTSKGFADLIRQSALWCTGSCTDH